MKLSENQAKVIKLMQDGYVLKVFGCFAGAVSQTWVHIVTLTKNDEPRSQERSNKGIVNSLIKRGLIEMGEVRSGGDSTDIFYHLTQKGKELCE